MSANTIGPDELADLIGGLSGYLSKSEDAQGRDLIAAWEADRRELSNVNADREKIWKALQEREAALERARALLAENEVTCTTYEPCACEKSEYIPHCQRCCLPEWAHRLAAAPGSGGAA